MTIKVTPCISVSTCRSDETVLPVAAGWQGQPPAGCPCAETHKRLLVNRDLNGQPLVAARPGHVAARVSGPPEVGKRVSISPSTVIARSLTVAALRLRDCGVTLADHAPGRCTR